MISINNLTDKNLKEIDELNEYTKYLLDYMKIDASFLLSLLITKEFMKLIENIEVLIDLQMLSLLL